jgi:hypothetical protein
MTAKLSFKTTQTPYGRIFDMKVTDSVKGTEQHYNLLTSRPTADYLKWVGPAYLAENGTAFRVGRNVAGGLVAWKSVKISSKFGQESYRMRSVPGGYKGDYVKCWSRNINGHTYGFSRIYWNAGQDGSTLRVRRLGNVVHEWNSSTPVKMK